MSIKDLLNDAAEIVNETLGSLCVYHPVGGGTIEGCDIIINQNKPLRTEFGLLAGYQVEVSILKSQVPVTDDGDIIVDDEGRNWRIEALIKETAAKWYCEVTEQ